MLQSYRFLLRTPHQFPFFYSSTSQFQEAVFIKDFLDNANERNHQQMQNSLKENISSINKLNTIIAFLDKSFKRNFPID